MATGGCASVVFGYLVVSLLRSLVAGGALDVCVFTLKRIARSFVVKRGYFFPAFDCMALLAIITQRTLMGIALGMTRDASLIFTNFEYRSVFCLTFMALATRNLSMLPIKPIFCLSIMAKFYVQSFEGALVDMAVSAFLP